MNKSTPPGGSIKRRVQWLWAEVRGSVLGQQEPPWPRHSVCDDCVSDPPEFLISPLCVTYTKTTFCIFISFN